MPELRRRLIGFLLLLLAPAVARAEALPTLVLVQNSGWMEPFYTDPRSDFRARLKALVARGADGGPVILASFNQDGQVAGRSSPERLFAGGYDERRVNSAIDRIDLPRKANGAFADSDFAQALERGIANLLGGKPGIVWMVTNNQNAPGNTPDWRNRTRDFFRLLQGSAGITRVYAFPVRGPASGQVFGRKEGYIVYALAYGERAAGQLDARVHSRALESLFGGPAVRLKPLDRQTVRFEITKSSCTLVPGQWIRLRVAGGRTHDCVLTGRLFNRLYPQTIRSAKVRVTLRPVASQPGLAQARILIDPGAVRNVPARGFSAPVTVTLKLPAQQRSGWLDRESRAAGVLSIALTDIRYGWDRNFLQRLSAVPLGREIGAAAAGELVNRQLPEIFLDATRLTESRSDVPLQVVATHSPWPLYLLLALLLLLGFGLLAWWRRRTPARAQEFTVDLGGETRKISIRKGEQRFLTNGRGQRFSVAGRGREPPLVTPVE